MLLRNVLFVPKRPSNEKAAPLQAAAWHMDVVAHPSGETVLLGVINREEVDVREQKPRLQVSRLQGCGSGSRPHPDWFAAVRNEEVYWDGFNCGVGLWLAATPGLSVAVWYEPFRRIPGEMKHLPWKDQQQ